MRKDQNAHLGEFWWSLGPWQEPAHVAVIPDGELSLMTWFNPSCKHDRCAYTIAECEVCKEYSAMMRMAYSEDLHGK